MLEQNKPQRPQHAISMAFQLYVALQLGHCQLSAEMASRDPYLSKLKALRKPALTFQFTHPLMNHLTPFTLESLLESHKKMKVMFPYPPDDTKKH